MCSSIVFRVFGLWVIWSFYRHVFAFFAYSVLCIEPVRLYRSVFSRREQWGRKKVKHEIGGRSNHQTKGSTIIYFSFSRIILKSLKESTVNKSLKLVCLCSFLQRPIVSFVCLLFHTLHKFCCPLTPAFGVKCFVYLDTQRLIPDSCLCMNRLEFRREPSGDPDKIQR